MGGFLNPDRTNGFTKLFQAFAFIGTARSNGVEDQRPKLKIRHQNPRLNDPGVAPSRPRRPSDTGFGPISSSPARTNQKSPLKVRPLITSSRLRSRVSKKRPDSKTPQAPAPSPETAGSKYEVLPPKVKVNTKQQDMLLVKHPVVPLLAESTTTRIRPNKVHVETEESNLAVLRPCLPHQRMHYLRRIGQGGEGHCDLFRLHTSPQTLLAVKTLNQTPELIRQKNNKRKPLEAHILKDLLATPHPHIVQMFGYTYTPRKTMLYYEYCSLGDLQDVVDAYFSGDVAIPEGFIWHVFLAIAKALAYLHTGYIALPAVNSRTDRSTLQIQNKEWTPILHRDIKPENIFFRSSSSSPYPIPLLADFGLAVNYTPKPYECSGTIVYQGPELPIQTSASDLWSLGATVHMLVHGQPPMIKKAENRSVDSWEWDPRSRGIKEVGSRGYSMPLGVTMRGVLRKKMEERVGGKKLIEVVEMGRRTWGGEDKRMEEWAFRKIREDEEGEREGKERGIGEKPWKRG
ncbi:MAG: hypothetical protein L6R40_005042 [Gallowayella cf. fulva]|nr:MAG: hypothetical protein L6R40_005042 [Xanthomendoza cf. fulva]